MRLRWRSAQPAEAATQLATVLGLRLDTSHGRHRLDLGSAVLDFLDLPPSGRRDDRLEVAGVAGGESEGRPRAGDATRATDREERVVHRAPPSPLVLVALGLATVDTERFAHERGWRIAPAPPDTILGAAVSGVEGAADLALLEPATEGRIAASLARWGEGPAVLYLWTADVTAARIAISGRGGRATAISAGPFGRAFAVVVGPVWGPHLVVVEREAVQPVAATIRR